jgi:hypothetical protein
VVTAGSTTIGSMRLLLGLAMLVLALASAAGAATPVTATMTTSARFPVVGQHWRFAVTVKRAAGRPLPARMRLQVVRGGTVIGCWKRAVIKPCTGANAGTWIPFEGKRSGVIAWPARWLGMKLTFEALVVADEQTLRLRAPITIQPKP